MLATFVVNSMTDDGAGTTLREAVSFAEQSLDPVDIVKFDDSVFANGGTIALQGRIISIVSNQIIIDGRNSAGVPLGITINGGGNDRIFSFGGAGDVEINGLTLTGGNSSSLGVGGGAILTVPEVSLTVKNSVISNRINGTGGGGAIRAYGNLTIENTTITGNSTTARGGGINFTGFSGGVLNIVSSVIADNDADFEGGGIRAESATVNIQSSDITGNESLDAGGGVFFSFGSELYIHSTMIRGNTSAGDGGGVYFNGNALNVLSRSEIRDNFADVSGVGNG